MCIFEFLNIYRLIFRQFASVTSQKWEQKLTGLTSNHQSSHPQISDAVLSDSEQSACNSQQCSDDDHSNQVKTATVKLHNTYSVVCTIFTLYILVLHRIL